MADEHGEKTEKPSAKRLKDARSKGQIARSRDLVAAISLLAVTGVLTLLGGAIVSRLGARIAGGLGRIGDRPLATVTGGDIARLVVADTGVLASAVGPLLAVAALAGLAGNLVQAGWVFAPEALTPDWTRLSPASGLRRLAPARSGVDLIKTVVAVAALSVLAFGAVSEAFESGATLAWMAPAAAASSAWARVLRLLWRTGLASLAIAVADYGVQWWRTHASMKMTKQELRDESKLNEGSPEIKARVRKVQREMTRRRMLKAVKNATVVVTNPTHFAVALEYRRDRMAAPVVVAKGADHMAARIKALARDHGVPTVENVSLAQALYKGAEVGDAIPASLFGAVAEVLAYLVRIRQLML